MIACFVQTDLAWSSQENLLYLSPRLTLQNSSRSDLEDTQIVSTSYPSVDNHQIVVEIIKKAKKQHKAGRQKLIPVGLTGMVYSIGLLPFGISSFVAYFVVAPFVVDLLKQEHGNNPFQHWLTALALVAHVSIKWATSKSKKTESDGEEKTITMGSKKIDKSSFNAFIPLTLLKISIWRFIFRNCGIGVFKEIAIGELSNFGHPKVIPDLFLALADQNIDIQLVALNSLEKRKVIDKDLAEKLRLDILSGGLIESNL